MKIYVNVECTCHVTDGEIKVEAPNNTSKNGIDVVREGEDYYVVRGDDQSTAIDIEPVDSIIIMKRNVDLTLERHACADILIIKVCPGSNVWLNGFDTIFPEMHPYCKGRISSYTMNPYVVDKLHIYMNPDYKNLSMVDLFRCTSEIKIHYCYNGLISGTYEENCTVYMPSKECRGSAIRILIKVVTAKIQRDINLIRNLEAYEILTTYPPLKSKIKKNTKGACLNCFQNKVDVQLLPCKHESLCYDCMYKFAEEFEYNFIEPIFFKCNQCKQYVEDIKSLRDNEAS